MLPAYAIAIELRALPRETEVPGVYSIPAGSNILLPLPCGASAVIGQVASRPF